MIILVSNLMQHCSNDLCQTGKTARCNVSTLKINKKKVVFLCLKKLCLSFSQSVNTLAHGKRLAKGEKKQDKK